jgi:PAS domain S-box-containing protein
VSKATFSAACQKRSVESVPIMTTQKTPQSAGGTESIKTQEPLLESEQVLPEPQQGIGSGSYLIDLATGTWKVSPDLYKIFGIDETSLRTLDEWVGLLHPSSQEKCIEYRSQEFSEKTLINYQCRIVRVNDGEERWVHGLEHIEYDDRRNPVRHLGRIQDITERKRTEEQRLLMQATMECLSEAIFWIDPDARFIYVNDAACRLLGYSREELLAQSVSDIDPSLSVESWPAHWAELKQRGSITFESAHRRKDGTVLQTEATVNYLQVAGKEYSCAIMRDITERKQGEKRTQRSEAFLRQVIDINPNLVFVKDREGRFTLANKAVAGVYGTTVENLIGKTDAAFNINHDEVEQFRRADLKVMNTMQEHVIPEEKITDAAGQVRWLQTVKRPIEGEDERVNHVLGVATDITERKLADSRLRRTQYAIDHATDGIFVIAQDGHFLDVNESACRRLGYTKEELLTKSVMDIDPNFPQTTWNSFWEEFKNTKFLRLETLHRDKSGETYPVEVVANYVLHEGEELDYAFVRDITERKQAEAALQAFQDQIRQMQKMEAIGELAGGIAHDFNNILTAILGNAQLASKKVASDHPVQPNLMRILEASDRASRLVHQILTFSHQQALPRTVMALQPVVNEALDLLRATIPASVELTVTFDAVTPQVLADATQIHQVLMNLCTNAWHALNKQSGKISVSLAPVRLSQPLHSLFATLPPGHYACLSVQDTGCGMDSDTVSRIFEPFFTTKPVGQGTGLGLSLVHGIVRGHEGAIVVDSYPGRGTTISVYFPAAEVRAYEGEPVKVSPAETPGRIRHLLYLDDEAMLVELVRAWFEPRGYRVTGCMLAAEALDAVRANPDGFDVVVTDYNMPGMSGLQVAHALAQIRANLPVVLVSGHLSPTAQAASLASNIKAMVSKTIMWEQLDGVINRLLNAPPQG